MKKILLSLVLIFVLLTVPTLAAENKSIVDDKNSGFENVSLVSETKWFRLVNASGENGGSGTKEGISIKTDGGHTGNNYLSVECESSWYSPSINIYPYLKAAGEGAYIISFWVRSSEGIKLPKQVLIRATAKDVVDEGGIYITNRSNGNFFATVAGSYEDEENGWNLFVTETINLEAEELKSTHSWWICMDSLSGTLDIDDFAITRDDDFELPETEPQATPEPKAKTELTYLTDDVKKNALVTENSTPAPTAAPTDAPDETDAPAPTNKKNGLSGGVTALLGGGAFILFAALGAGFIALKKK